MSAANGPPAVRGAMNGQPAFQGEDEAARERGGRWLIVCCAVALPFLVARFVPATDLAQHVAQLRLLADALTGRSARAGSTTIAASCSRDLRIAVDDEHGRELGEAERQHSAVRNLRPGDLVVKRQTVRWTPALDWLPHTVRREDFALFDAVMVQGSEDDQRRAAELGGLEALTPPARWRLYRPAAVRPAPAG